MHLRGCVRALKRHYTGHIGHIGDIWKGYIAVHTLWECVLGTPKNEFYKKGFCCLAF